VRKHLPNSLLHFEDFGVKNAHRILQRYHDTHAVFNDDMCVYYLLLPSVYQLTFLNYVDKVQEL